VAKRRGRRRALAAVQVRTQYYRYNMLALSHVRALSLLVLIELTACDRRPSARNSHSNPTAAAAAAVIACG
jgi:hypothetical protein